MSYLSPDQQHMLQGVNGIDHKMLEYMLAYPDSAIRVYEKNKAKIEEAIAYLESE